MSEIGCEIEIVRKIERKTNLFQLDFFSLSDTEHRKSARTHFFLSDAFMIDIGSKLNVRKSISNVNLINFFLVRYLINVVALYRRLPCSNGLCLMQRNILAHRLKQNYIFLFLAPLPRLPYLPRAPTLFRSICFHVMDEHRVRVPSFMRNIYHKHQ